MKKLLLCDDNELHAQGVALGLRGRGYVCDCVIDGPSALAALSASGYDAAIIDRILPGAFDGLETVTRLRALPDAAAANTPVVLVTACGDEEVAALAALLPGLRPVRLLRKPFTLEALEHWLADLWGSPAPA